jgi:hypothetical protein
MALADGSDRPTLTGMPNTLLPASLQVALKEWATVCTALLDGRQIVLLRKGGIYEAAGEFQVEHPSFLLFPTYLHQSLKMLKPEAHAGFATVSAEPAEIRLEAAGVVSDIVPVASRRQMDALDDAHIWAPPLVDMRFSYRPENPLYLLLVRAYRLTTPITSANTPAYAGCKSWVPLDVPVDTQRAVPALGDDKYDRQRESILARVSAG